MQSGCKAGGPTMRSHPPHSDPQLRTRKTVLDSWVWLGATEVGNCNRGTVTTQGTTLSYLI